MLKLLQEMRGFAESATRRPSPQSPALILMQMRSHVIQAALPKRKLRVQMDVQDRLNISYPVKISYVKQAPAPGATLPAS